MNHVFYFVDIYCKETLKEINMKINLAENMLRFGVKNLKTSNKVNLNAIIEQQNLADTTPEQDTSYADQIKKQGGVKGDLNYAAAADTKTNPTAADYNEYKDEMWVIPYGSFIVHQADLYTKNSFAYYYKSEPGKFRSVYPNWSNLKVPTEWVAQSKKEFNDEFIKRYNAALKNRNWLLYVANEYNKLFNTTVKKPSETVKNIQAFIASQMKGDPLVDNNGTPGQPFADGVWGVVSTRAWLTYAIQNINPFNTIQQIAIQAKTKSTNNTTKEPYVNS